MLEVEKVFKRAYDHTPTHVTIAPGCVEVLGGHTEAHEGLLLTFALDRHIQLAASSRSDGRVRLRSSTFPGEELFWVSTLTPNLAAPWADPVKGVLSELRRRGVGFGGFDAAIHSTLPPGAGLGSGVALAIATALTVRKLRPYRVTDTGVMNRPPQRDRRGQIESPARAEKLALARLCRDALTGFAGTPCGLAAPLTALRGQRLSLLAVDGRHETTTALPLHGEFVFILCPTGLSTVHDIAEIAARRAACDTAARKLHATTLRSVDPPWLREHMMALTEQEYACAYHVVGEISRVAAAHRALDEGDFVQFGHYLTQSHESARDFHDGGVPEAELLVKLALSHPGCAGARLMSTGEGTGGGMVLAMVTHNDYADFLKRLPRHYEERTGRRVQPLIAIAGDGAK